MGNISRLEKAMSKETVTGEWIFNQINNIEYKIKDYSNALDALKEPEELGFSRVLLRKELDLAQKLLTTLREAKYVRLGANEDE